MTAQPKPGGDPDLIDAIAHRVRHGLQLRRRLPPDGRIHIDRNLPFIVVYRPPDGDDDGLQPLVASQASYLIAPSGASSDRFVREVVERVATIQSEVFGAFLVIELWHRPHHPTEADGPDDVHPGFDIAIERALDGTPTVSALAEHLEHVRVLGRTATVTVRPSVPASPRGRRRLIGQATAKAANVQVIGIATTAAWRSERTGETYPLVRRALVRQVSRALGQAAFVFAREETSSRPLHYHQLGRRAVVRAVHQVDHELADVAESFDLLLAVTPVDTEAAFRRFRRSRQDRQPTFRYRPNTIDPSLLKRRLFNIRIERIEDPTLERLFREKQVELELKLSLVGDRLTERFLPTSVALFGNVTDEAVASARAIIDATETATASRKPRRISGEQFAAAAQAELTAYREVDPSIQPTISIRDDISSLMVSSGNLLVGRGMAIPADRVDALIQHEVGTHVVTYWNGRAQPLRLLASGLARHDELQEGLGVFAEYLVGGLTANRMRTLAARVLAARSVIDGASFLETHRLLVADAGLSSRTAFMVTTRVHRGGGFVKDAVYLRGLEGVVEYLRRGGRLDTLLVGKIAPDHTAVIEELQRREVLGAPPLRPTYLNLPDTHYQIERIRSGADLTELVR